MPTIASGDREITVTVLSGAMGAVEPGQTCYIGTTLGGHDLGRLRVRKGLGTTVTLAENSVQWKDAWYLTVTSFHEAWGVYPRILLDASNVPTFYKDYDIPYGSQNEDMEPVVCMGPNHAGFLDDGVAQVYYTSSGTYNPTPGWEGSAATGSIAAYHWFFGNGPIVPTGSDSAVPGYVTYTGAGFYTTKLDVVTVEGVTGTGYRHVSIYDRPNEGPAMPPLRWGFDALDGSISSGGYSARLWVREVSDWSKVVDGALVVLWTEAWEGNAEAKVGGNSPHRDAILFCGYIDDGSIRMNAETNRLEFSVSSITETLKDRGTFSAALDNVLIPTTWNEMKELTVDRAVVHYLRWHSTALGVADFSPTGDLKPVHFVDFDRGSIYDTANSLLDSALIGWMVADRQGKMWCETNPSLRDTGTSRGLTSILDLTRQDWMGEVGIETQPHGGFSYLEMGGLAYTGPTTGTDAAFLSGAPGEAPAYFGSLQKTTGLVVSGQEQLNRLTGHALAKANSPYPRIDVNMAGDYRLIDIAPQERVLLTMGASDNWRGLEWTQKALLVEEVNLEYKPEAQALLTNVSFGEETVGEPGMTVTIPEESPWDDPDVPEWNPEWIFPPLPPPPVLPPVEPPPGTGPLVYVTTRNRITRTRNFWDAVPVWENVSPAGTGTSFGNEWERMFQFHLDPADPMNSAYLMTRDTSIGNPPAYIYHTTNLNAATPTWTKVYNGPTDGAYLNYTGSGFAFAEWANVDCMDASPVGPGLLWIATSYFVNFTLDYGATWQRAGHPRVVPTGGGSGRGIRSCYYTPDRAYVVMNFYTDIYRTVTQGGLWTIVTPGDNSNVETVTTICVPWEGNTGHDYFVYASEDEAGARTNAWIFVSNSWGAWRLETTPVIASTRYGCYRSGVIDYNVRIVDWAGNGDHIALIGNPVDGVSPIASAGPSVIFGSNNGGLSWTPLHVFGGDAGCLRWHQTNENLMYAVGDANSGYIMASSDGGLNWQGKVAAWVATFGSPAVTGWNNPAIHVVWTV